MGYKYSKASDDDAERQHYTLINDLRLFPGDRINVSDYVFELYAVDKLTFVLYDGKSPNPAIMEKVRNTSFDLTGSNAAAFWHWIGLDEYTAQRYREKPCGKSAEQIKAEVQELCYKLDNYTWQKPAARPLNEYITV